VLEDVDKGRLVAYAAVLLLVIAVALRLHAHGSGGGASVALEEPARAAPVAAGGPSAATRPTSASGRELYVDVAGAVRRPGLYRLPAGSRVAAAVERAGGLSRRAERTGVNLAAPLADGQQVVVPVRGSAGAVGAGGAAASGASGPASAGGAGGTISLSTASEAELETIDGIGPALAGRIIEYRDTHGGFHSIDELKQVSGIGDKRFETLSKALRP
jgi:competence protein ComEA